jgi:hypothetical protein
VALEDIIGGDSASGDHIPVHGFMALLHWRVRDPVRVTNAKAKSALEDHLGRLLTGEEETKLLAIINDIETAQYDARDLEAAYILRGQGWVTLAEAKALLGI